MVPSRRRYTRKPGKTSVEDELRRACASETEDEKDLCGSRDAADEKTAVIDTLGKKRSSAGMVEDTGGDVQNMLERFGVVDVKSANDPDGAGIDKALYTKRKRLEMYAKAVLKTSDRRIKNVWKIQKEQRNKLIQGYSQQFMTVFQQWETERQKTEEEKEKLANLFEQQQRMFQQSCVVQGQRLKTIRQLYEQFKQSMEDLEKKNGNLVTDAQNELRNEMAMFQKRIMMETQQQEMAAVRKSLQSMLF